MGEIKRERKNNKDVGSGIKNVGASSASLHNEVPLIEIINEYKIYIMGTEQVYANDNINLKIYKGEFVAIVGKSGSGKSTLMNIIGALDKPTSGNYILNGTDTSKMTDDDLALESLAKVGLREKYRNYPNQLSGGQQQRVSIARALAGKPSLLLADEPTGALDSKTSREVLNFLKQLHEEGNTIVMITHDNSIAVEAKRVVRIKDGQINFDGTAEEYGTVIQAGN